MDLFCAWSARESADEPRVVKKGITNLTGFHEDEIDKFERFWLEENIRRLDLNVK